MDRLFALVLVLALLAGLAGKPENTQPVFFCLLFPGLIPEDWTGESPTAKARVFMGWARVKRIIQGGMEALTWL